MIGLDEGGISSPETPQNKTFLKVAFYEWFTSLSPDDHMMTFNAICGIARGRFRDKSLAFAISQLKILVTKPDSESMYLPEEIATIETFVKSNQPSAEGLTSLEIRDFILDHVYHLI